MNKNEFKELENKKLQIMNEDETTEINGGGAYDLILDIINYFRGK